MNLCRMRSILRAVVAASIILIVAEPLWAQAKPRSRNALAILQDSHRQKFREFSTQLEKLEQFCKDKGLTDAADTVRSRISVPDLESRNLKVLPREVTPPIPNNVSADERYWQSQMRDAEKSYAQDLYLLSKRALNDGLPGYAFALVRECALHDPDHQLARKILGFVRQGNEWVTTFAASQIKVGNVWHEDFGWLPKAHLDHYSRGERYYKGKWITSAKERELRRDFADAWVVRTDHYEIKTNVSLESGVKLGRALEDFHEFFYETFAGFFNTPEQMRKLFFDGTTKSNPPRPYRVHFYRTRDEYNDRLRNEFPNIEASNGVYTIHGRVVHFFHDPMNNNEATLFHEASHQLFYESHVLNRSIADRAHFWIIEGIACYMESFQRDEGSFSIGDPSYVRFEDARVNLLDKNYYVPLEKFASMGMEAFQRAPDLPKNYTQAAGLARFFMEFDNGRYREALVQHLAQLYSSDTRVRDSAVGLDRLTGVDYDELDQQYAKDLLQQQRALPMP